MLIAAARRLQGAYGCCHIQRTVGGQASINTQTCTMMSARMLLNTLLYSHCCCQLRSDHGCCLMPCMLARYDNIRMSTKSCVVAWFQGKVNSLRRSGAGVSSSLVQNTACRKSIGSAKAGHTKSHHNTTLDCMQRGCGDEKSMGSSTDVHKIKKCSSEKHHMQKSAS